MPFVEDIHDRRHIHSRVFSHSRIHIVADGNEPDIVGREQIICVLPDFNIVPAEAAEVLDKDGIDPAGLGIIQQVDARLAVKVQEIPVAIQAPQQCLGILVAKLRLLPQVVIFLL